MIATIVLTGMLASLLFVLAAYLAERGLHALGRPTRYVWILASVAAIAVPVVQLLALSIEATSLSTEAASAQTLPLTTILTVGVVERFSAARVANLEYWLIGLWVCATTLISVRLVLGSRALRRSAQTWSRSDVCGVSVWISEAYGPAVIGLRHPKIVVPRRIAELSLEEQRLALAHELEHIAARDQCLVHAAALIVAAVPWNPFVWFAARRLRSAIEIDCDARVLQNKPNVSAYASLVLHVASWPRESAAAALALGAGAITQLERRLRIMMSPTSRRFTPAVLSIAGALALAVYGCEVAVNVDQPNRQGALSSQNVVHQLPTVLTTAVTTDRPYFEFQVDKPVTMAPGSPAPRYPQVLRQAGVEGEVLVQFVVDADGHPDPSTFKVLKSSHDLFAQSVQLALPQLRFIPAEVRGGRVKQLVRQPFAYTIAK
ncbi:MAG: M56 family metallopeptidase [Gemmatimonadaceae bacterium]